jgi:hypothetical protein
MTVKSLQRNERRHSLRTTVSSSIQTATEQFNQQVSNTFAVLTNTHSNFNNQESQDPNGHRNNEHSQDDEGAQEHRKRQNSHQLAFNTDVLTKTNHNHTENNCEINSSNTTARISDYKPSNVPINTTTNSSSNRNSNSNNINANSTKTNSNSNQKKKFGEGCSPS